MNRITYLFISLIFILVAQNTAAQNVVINEILTSNTNVNTDEDASYQDWVELYNTGTTAVNLNGYGLSDDPALPLKWTFPNVTIAPGAYMLIWCSDKNRIIPGSPLHTNFKISSDGETITLSNAAGTSINSVPATAIESNMSFGRFPNGTGPFVFFTTVTPNAANSTGGFSEILSPPTLSAAGGFYTTAFNLTISTTTPGATILYTLDGSEPDAANIGGNTYFYKNKYAELVGQTAGPLLPNSYQTLVYSAPVNIINRTPQPNKLSVMSSTHHYEPDYFPQVPIFKGTVVRAKVTKPGALPSPIITKTYFVSPLGANEFTIPVVSLSLNEDRFFDYNDGIFVAGTDFDSWRASNPTVNATPYNFDANFRRSGDPAERAGNLNYFVNGQEVLNQDIGIRINGGATRAWQSKSIRLVGRSEFGDADFDYQFFSGESLTKFNRLILRNSGSDFFNTMYRDALAQTLIKGLLPETQAYQPTITFVNGEYWGILNLRERYDKYYFKNVFDIEDGELDLLEDALEVAEGDNDHYQEMTAFMEDNSLAVQSNYDYVATQLDPDNWRDYFIANIFYGNVDWPGWNTEFWRKRTTAYVPDALYGHDGRWRTAFKDMDSSFGLTLDINDHNTLEFATEPDGPEYPNPPFSTLILRSLLENTTFKNGFISRFADLMNSYFEPQRVIAVSTSMKNTILPEITDHIARWSNNDYGWWQQSVNIMHTFALERPDYQREHIREKFGIANDIDVTLNVSNDAHGHIKINTIDIIPTTPGIPADSYPWTGIYFSNIPVKLKAVANEGFVFSHWTGASTSTLPEITITSANAFSVTAVFVPDNAPAASEPIYFWMMDDSMANNLPLETLNTTFEADGVDGVIQYQSSLVGYPFTATSPLWRKASMERRNSPTTINYIPEANNNIAFADSEMRGLQIKEPFQSGSLQNTMVFDFSTDGYDDIKFSFAAMNEGTNATGIIVDYAINAGTPTWTTSGLTASVLPLNNAFGLYNVDFTPIAGANNNENFKIRLRFAGSDMTVDNGNRVTFNNIAVHGTAIQLNVEEQAQNSFIVYPNPVSDIINVGGLDAAGAYKIFTIDGRLVKSGEFGSIAQINVGELTRGMYMVEITSSGKKEVKKILKK